MPFSTWHRLGTQETITTWLLGSERYQWAPVKAQTQHLFQGEAKGPVMFSSLPGIVATCSQTPICMFNAFMPPLLVHHQLHQGLLCVSVCLFVNGSPLQYSCLENPMDRGAWLTTVRGVAKSQTRLSNSHTHTTPSCVWPDGIYSVIGARRPELKSWLLHSSAVLPQASYLTFLCLIFLLYNIEKYLPRRVVVMVQ